MSTRIRSTSKSLGLLRQRHAMLRKIARRAERAFAAFHRRNDDKDAYTPLLAAMTCLRDELRGSR